MMYWIYFTAAYWKTLELYSHLLVTCNKTSLDKALLSIFQVGIVHLNSIAVNLYFNGLVLFDVGNLFCFQMNN
jgi:hypothetical protein